MTKGQRESTISCLRKRSTRGPKSPVNFANRVCVPVTPTAPAILDPNMCRPDRTSGQGPLEALKPRSVRARKRA